MSTPKALESPDVGADVSGCHGRSGQDRAVCRITCAGCWGGDIPWDARQEVALWFSRYFLEKGDFERSLDVLGRFLQTGPGGSEPRGSGFEQAYFRQWLERAGRRAGDRPDQGRSRLVNQWRFPYALTAFEHGGAHWRTTPTAGAATWRTLRNLAASAELADHGPARPTGIGRAGRRVTGLPSVGGLALALPITGPYAKVGVKILRGAGLAQWRLAQDGVEVDLRVDQHRDSRLGGAAGRVAWSLFRGRRSPLRVGRLQEALRGRERRAQKCSRQRAVFTFLASLGDLTEGQGRMAVFHQPCG